MPFLTGLLLLFVYSNKNHFKGQIHLLKFTAKKFN